MFSKEETRWVLGILVPFFAAHVILYLCGYEDSSFGAPVNKWILLLIWIGNSFYYWTDKKAFLKRCVLALPFALLTVLLLGLTVFELSDSWIFGVLMLILLTRETKNLKGGFVISLIIGTILIGLLAILVVLIKSALAGPVK